MGVGADEIYTLLVVAYQEKTTHSFPRLMYDLRAEGRSLWLDSLSDEVQPVQNVKHDHHAFLAEFIIHYGLLFFIDSVTPDHSEW